MAYRLFLTTAAQRDMKALPPDILKRVDAHLLALIAIPRPSGSEKMKGEKDMYRIRVGKYRILYQIQDDALAVTVGKVAHRKEVYRKR